MVLRTSRIASVLALVLAVACGDSPIAPPASDGGSLTPAAVVAWKGYVWTTTPAATAVVDGNDNLVLTRVAAGDMGVQIAAFDPSINASGTPWMLFSYVDDGTSVQGYDLFVNYNSSNARLSGGSLFSCDGLGYERFGVPAQEDFLFAVGCGDRAGGDHTVYFGERGGGWSDSSLWKNQGSCIQYANTGDKKASEVSGN